MAEPLTPAELGDVGEDLFRSLCSKARLTCNKSDRDKTGWDFRVEFPNEGPTVATLDQRLPRVCQIQLKSTAGESGSRVTARLSSIDRLAKDAAPAAIVILRLRPDGTELMGYVIHLIDDELGRILRRLRRAQADGRTDINHMTISFDYRKGRRFKPTAAGLREALAEVCPEDVATYAEKKQHQLARLGYGEGGDLEAEALVWIEDKDHLTRILSGLAPIKPIRLQAYDRRFGIRVPYLGSLLDGIDEFPIELPAVGPCDIVVRRGPRRPAALFRCEAFAPPPIDDAPLLVIKHAALTAMFKEDGLDVHTGDINEGRRSLDEWILLLRALTYLASGEGTIEAEFRGTRLPPMIVPAGTLHGPYIEQLPQLLEFVERWREALSLAGVAPAFDFSLDQVWQALPVQISLDILLNPAPVAKIEFDVTGGSDGKDVLKALYFNNVEFAGVAVAYAVEVVLERQAPSAGFASVRYDLIDIRPGVSDLPAYGAEMATARQLHIVIDPSNLEFVHAGEQAETE